jgi:carbamoyl-phosphate synthase large subunit
MKTNVLITSAGRRVSLVKSFINAASMVLPGAKVITVDMNPDLSAACTVSDLSYQICSVTDSNYSETLKKICVENNVGLVIPTIDTELVILAKNRNDFEKHGINIIVSSVPVVKRCRNKRESNLLFEELGIKTPKLQDKQNLEFPVFIKPFNGSLSSEIHLIRERSQLSEYLLTNDKFMFMEYIDSNKFDEYTVDIYYDRGGNLKCLVPRKRIEVRGGEISKGITVKNILYEELKEKLSELKGARGCITAQFFLSKEGNNIYGIEINARFGGGYTLSYFAGAVYPEFLIQEYLLNSSVSFHEEWKENLLMLRFDQEIIIANE